MKQTSTSLYKRINITLPKDTIQLLNKVAAQGERSRLIDKALRAHISKAGRAELRKQLIEGYIANAERDLQMAKDWFPLEEEAWQKSQA